MDDIQHNLDLPAEKLPDTLCILPLFDTVLFPKMALPLILMQYESVKLIDESMSDNRIIGLNLAKTSAKTINYEPDDLYSIGTSAFIMKMAKIENTKAQLLVHGIHKYKIIEFIQQKPYLKAKVKHLEDIEVNDKETQALVSNLFGMYPKFIELSQNLPNELIDMVKNIEQPGIFSDMITSTLNISVKDKQAILETLDVKQRLKATAKHLQHQLEILQLGSKIHSQVKNGMDQKQREYYLRQKLVAIKKELGEKEDSNIETNEYKNKIKENHLPKEAEKEANRELDRLSKMHPSSSEYTVSSTYLDWITSLPWDKSTKDNLNIKKAQKILDEDHFGLEKAKKRIIEYLAVRKLKSDSKGPILCFVGPPGTGKTSLGRSVARALGRKFIRFSLGGVRDEAEIRGHRRTYVGALPGRIIQGIRRAESKNPVFMLDEIDKVGSDYRGDPSSALLEVLDPEQNNSFSDHYLDVSFDLSNVMFITTANILDTIPPALKDRMEVLRLLGYSEDEKIQIAKTFLIPRQLKEHGLNENQLFFTKGALKIIISKYTKEAGLRNLEREIASICRQVATKIVNNEIKLANVKVKDIKKYLGHPKFMVDEIKKITVKGVAIGMAWTEFGGEILFIEATSMKGKNNLTLTGQLGDVMKESATAALSYIRSNSKLYDIDEDYFDKHDIHIHVPAGAIPKDGPSAGVTMLCSLVSLLTNKIVKNDLAMTGEITLRGQILPVGGIKEKVLAAHRAGITKIVLPKLNKNDIDDIPKKIQKNTNFIFVDKMDDVIKIAIEN